MGIVRMGPPTEIILRLKKAYGIKTFIETGTYSGNTAYWASQVFEKVVTIEYSEIIYKQVTEKYSQILNIEFMYGDTRNRLREIVSQLDAPSIFWLDAHWSGGSTYGEADQCPLIKEIEIINSNESEQLIFIDDARLFLSPPPEPNSAEQWPEIKEVLNVLKSKYVVIIEDVIIAVPSFAKSIVLQYCKEVNTNLWKAYSEGMNKIYGDSGKGRKEELRKKEQRRIDELRLKIKQLGKIEEKSRSEAEKKWLENRRRLRQLILEEDVRKFLTWDAIGRTMLYEPPVKRLQLLQELPDWPIWEQGIQETPVGDPKPYFAYKASSGTLIHHACHFAHLAQVSGFSMQKIEKIIEFGGGYGSMCRLAYQLGFKGRYIIFDLPEVSLLQEFYLKSLYPEEKITRKAGDKEGLVILITDIDELSKTIENGEENYLFLGMWSISEVPGDLRGKIFNIAEKAKYYLMGYQGQFGEVNNIRYFGDLINKKGEYYWESNEIEEIPGNYYLVGWKKSLDDKTDKDESSERIEAGGEERDAIGMSTLGINGRFANQIFQYAFLKIYAKEHNLRVETPEWIGQYLFGHQDPQISQQRRVVQEQTSNLDAAIIPNAQKPFKNVDFWGYFQYNTKYYAPHKEYFRSLFEPVEEIKRKMTEAILRLREKGKTIVALHLRRGDYGYDYFFVAPSEWYKEWLKGLWEIFKEPVLYIASDEPEKVIGDFAEYSPVTAKDLGVELPSAEFYPDFYILSHADVVAISNSSFSFAACMLNEKSKIFFRPHLPTEKLISFDPWNSETIFRDANVLNPESADLIADPLEGLKLSEVNVIIFPNWNQSEESLSEELAGVIKSVVTHPDHSRMTLLIESSDIDEEDANLIVSGVIMHLLLSEELDVTEGPEISLFGKLSERQWEMLLGCIHARIGLENENQMAVKAENMRSDKLDSLAKRKFDGEG